MSLHILPCESLAIASMFYMKKIQVWKWNDVDDVIGVISSMLHRHVAAVMSVSQNLCMTTLGEASKDTELQSVLEYT